LPKVQSEFSVCCYNSERYPEAIEQASEDGYFEGRQTMAD